MGIGGALRYGSSLKLEDLVLALVKKHNLECVACFSACMLSSHCDDCDACDDCDDCDACNDCDDCHDCDDCDASRYKVGTRSRVRWLFV